MSDQVAFVAEGPSAFGALVRLFSRRWWDVRRIVVEVLVAFEELFLPEGLITLLALIGLLIRVDEHVAF